MRQEFTHQRQIAEFIFEHCDKDKSEKFVKWLCRIGNESKLTFDNFEATLKKEFPGNETILNLLNDLYKKSEDIYQNRHIGLIAYFLQNKLHG